MDHTEKTALERKIRELQICLDAERDHHRYWHTVATVALSVLTYETVWLIALAFIIR